MKDPSNTTTRKEEVSRKQHLLIGGGGTKSILAGVGAFCGLQSKGRNEWSSIGGISGGSIPAVFIADGMSPTELIRLSVRTDFNNLLASKRHLWKVLRRYMSQKNGKLPIKALMSSEPLGDFIDEMVPQWPESFWTMAMAEVKDYGRCQIVFTKDGVFLYSLEGDCVKLTNRPPSVGTAVRATCAIPGVIGAIEYEDMHLFDGMLTWDGACPVGVIGKHFNAEAPDITAVDVGTQNNWFGVIQRRYMRHWCGKSCKETKEIFKAWLEMGINFIEAPLVGFGGVKLDFTPKEKWLAIKSSYRTARDNF